MEIRYTAAPDDVTAMLRYNLRRSPRAWIPLACVALCPTLFGVLPSFARGSQLSAYDVGSAVVIGLVSAAVLPLWVRFRVKRDERVLVVGPEGIATQIGGLRATIPWRRIAFIGVTNEHVFITGKSTNGFAVPRRAFETGAQRDEFVRLVHGYHAETQTPAGRAI